LNRFDRLTGILLALQAGRKTAAELANRFEVSRRTILRDVDALCQIGVPVVAIPGATGGYEIASGFWLAPLQLTTEEASLLLLALKSLGNEHAPFGLARRTVEEKLRALLPSDLLRRADLEVRAIDFAPPHRAERLGHLAALRTALSAGCWLRIDYRSANRAALHDIFPLRLFVDANRWYCEAASLAATDKRVYRVDRMFEVERIPPPLEAAAVIAGATASTASNGSRAALDIHEITVELTYTGIRKLEDHPDFLGCLTETETGGLLIFSTPASELDYFARELFAIGPEARVVQPSFFRDKIIEIAHATARRYSSD
jgi:predicted DNA-binding transcriptional regulator YafY